MKPTRLAVTLLFALAANAAAQSTPDLAGLWGATLRFRPDTRGPLIIYRTPDASSPLSGTERGTGGEDRAGQGVRTWRAMVTPLDNRLTFFLPITRQADGTLRTYLRNPERNAGWFP